MRLLLENSVKRGHQIHLIGQIRLIRMTNFLTGVVKQQRTTAAILIIRIFGESGVIQWIQTKDGPRATFHSAVSLLLNVASDNVTFCRFLMQTG